MFLTILLLIKGWLLSWTNIMLSCSTAIYYKIKLQVCKRFYVLNLLNQLEEVTVFN